MFAHQVHFLIESLDACHVSFCIVCKLNFLSAAHSLCAPVEISHIYRASDLSGNCMETGFPALYRLTGSLGRKGEVHYFLSLHFLDYAQCHVASSLSVNRNASELSEQPAERTDEKFTLDHAVRLSAY